MQVIDEVLSIKERWDEFDVIWCSDYNEDNAMFFWVIFVVSVFIFVGVKKGI